MADSSFDIVSKVDKQEVDNALNQAAKEVAQRYDLKNVGASIEWAGGDSIQIKANTAERVLAANPARDSTRMIEAVMSRSPWLHVPFETAIGSAQFQADRAAFADDLLRTGLITRERADRIAATVWLVAECVPPIASASARMVIGPPRASLIRGLVNRGRRSSIPRSR